MSQHEPTLEEPLSDDAAGEEEEEEDADALELKEVEESEQSGVADDHDLRVNTTRQAWLVKVGFSGLFPYRSDERERKRKGNTQTHL